MKTFVDLTLELEQLLGIRLYLVGGAVRNSLLGLPIEDYDFTTPATPDEIEQKIKIAGYKPYTVGKRFGTVGFKYLLQTTVEGLSNSNIKTIFLEITTFRSEIYNSESRKPEIDFVTDINKDLERRDFTINSLALDSKGQLIDNCSGQSDLESKILRAAGRPSTRFLEDPLRLLRAVRFAAEYGFQIEAETKQAMTANYLKLLDISKERWMIEMDKILTGNNVSIALELLRETGLLQVMIPELSCQHDFDQNSPCNDFDLWKHTKKVVENTPNNDINLRWGALLHDIAKPFTKTENIKGHINNLQHEKLGADMVIRLGKHLKWSNHRIEKVSQLVANHLQPDSELWEYNNSGKKMV